MSSPTTNARPDDLPAITATRSLASSFTELPTSRGRTSITDDVVQTIAGVAACRVAGIYNTGRGAGRFGTLRAGTSGPAGQNPGHGVSVRISGRRAVVDLEVVVDYGVAIVPLVQTVRSDVVEWVQTLTGLEVTEVNIAVIDLHQPSDDESGPGRVR